MEDLDNLNIIHVTGTKGKVSEFPSEVVRSLHETLKIDSVIHDQRILGTGPLISKTKVYISDVQFPGVNMCFHRANSQNLRVSNRIFKV